jgi:hypothetical protein
MAPRFVLVLCVGPPRGRRDEDAEEVADDQDESSRFLCWTKACRLRLPPTWEVWIEKRAAFPRRGKGVV